MGEQAKIVLGMMREEGQDYQSQPQAEVAQASRDKD